MLFWNTNNVLGLLEGVESDILAVWDTEGNIVLGNVVEVESCLHMYCIVKDLQQRAQACFLVQVCTHE